MIGLVCWSYFPIVIHIAPLTTVFLASPCPQSPLETRAVIRCTVLLWQYQQCSAAGAEPCGFRQQVSGGKDGTHTELFPYCRTREADPRLLWLNLSFLDSVLVALVQSETEGGLADQKDCMFRVSI